MLAAGNNSQKNKFSNNEAYIELQLSLFFFQKTPFCWHF